MLKNSTKKFARAGACAGLYVVLTLLALPISSGAIQFRPSEALCLLPLIFPETTVGVFIGCLLSNLIAGSAPWDIALGSLITLLAGVFTFVVGKYITKTWVKILVGGAFPVILNAFILPAVWLLCYGNLGYVYIAQAALLLTSQTLSVYALGTPLYLALKTLNEKGII